MPPRQAGYKIAKLYESQVKRNMNITYTHSFPSKHVSSNLSPLKSKYQNKNLNKEISVQSIYKESQELEEEMVA
jgi:hypothetical protein